MVNSLDPRDRTPLSNYASTSGPAHHYRGPFAYVAGSTAQDGSIPLFRLRYLGSPHQWGFAIYLASKDGYEDSILLRGSFTGAPEEALDCACGLYLHDISAWTEPREPARFT